MQLLSLAQVNVSQVLILMTVATFTHLLQCLRLPFAVLVPLAFHFMSSTFVSLSFRLASPTFR